MKNSFRNHFCCCFSFTIYTFSIEVGFYLVLRFSLKIPRDELNKKNIWNMFVVPRFRVSYGKARILIAFPRTYITCGNYVFPGSRLALQHQFANTYTHSDSVDGNLFAGTEVITNCVGRGKLWETNKTFETNDTLPEMNFKMNSKTLWRCLDFCWKKWNKFLFGFSNRFWHSNYSINWFGVEPFPECFDWLIVYANVLLGSVIFRIFGFFERILIGRTFLKREIQSRNSPINMFSSFGCRYCLRSNRALRSPFVTLPVHCKLDRFSPDFVHHFHPHACECGTSSGLKHGGYPSLSGSIVLFFLLIANAEMYSSRFSRIHEKFIGFWLIFMDFKGPSIIDKVPHSFSFIIIFIINEMALLTMQTNGTT